MRPRRSRRGSVLSDLGSTRGTALQRIPNIGPPTTGVGIITGPQIGPGAIGPTHVQPGAITGSALAPGAFDITHFASGIRPVAIVGALPTLPDANYPPGAVIFLTTDDKIYRNDDGAWTRSADGADLLADSITAGQIAAGAIGASEIAAGAITTEKLTVGILQDSVLLNASFEEADSAVGATKAAMWQHGFQYGATGQSRTTADSYDGAAAYDLNPGAGVSCDVAPSAGIPASAGETWYLSVWAKKFGSGASDFYVGLWGGTVIGTQNSHISWAPAAAVNVPTTWTKYEASIVIPAGVTYIRPTLLNYINNTGAGVRVDNVTLQKAVGSANIVDLSVSTLKIAGQAITPSKLSFDALAQLFIYGDGNDGDVTLSGNTTLTRDMVYNNLTINGGVVLSPNGFRIFVKGTLTNNGTIRCNGNAGSAGTNGVQGAGGAALPVGTMGGSGAGGTANGAVAPTVVDALGGVGGTGGRDTTLHIEGGCTAPTYTATDDRHGLTSLIHANRHGLVTLSDSTNIRGGTGGGGGDHAYLTSGGCGDWGSFGGGGGSGGGVIVIAAKTLTNNGTIEAKGGAGGAGYNGHGCPSPREGGGGGGGGGGGAIVLVYRTITTGTISVAAGAGGAGGTGFAKDLSCNCNGGCGDGWPICGPGIAGSAGTTGTILLVQQEA